MKRYYWKLRDEREAKVASQPRQPHKKIVSQQTARTERRQLPMEGLNEGRIVHYTAYNQRNLAALVIGGDFTSGTVNLAVFSDMPNVNGGVNMGLQFQAAVPYSEEPKPGTWHWIFPGQATSRAGGAPR